jgi:hypothetical protein
MELFQEGKAAHPDLDYAVVADEHLIAFGFDWPMADELELDTIFPFEKLPEMFRSKWHEFAFSNTRTQLFLIGKIQILFIRDLGLDMVLVKTIEPNELLEKIEDNKNKVLTKATKKQKRIELENKYAAQTHFNEDQKTTITTILNALDEARAAGNRVLTDCFIYARINATIITTPLDKNTVFGDENRWYSVRKEEVSCKNMEQIEFRINSQIGERRIAKQYGWHNPKQKKHVSEEEFRAFLNEEISFEDLKHQYKG